MTTIATVAAIAALLLSLALWLAGWRLVRRWRRNLRLLDSQVQSLSESIDALTEVLAIQHSELEGLEQVTQDHAKTLERLQHICRELTKIAGRHITRSRRQITEFGEVTSHLQKVERAIAQIKARFGTSLQGVAPDSPEPGDADAKPQQRKPPRNVWNA